MRVNACAAGCGLGSKAATERRRENLLLPDQSSTGIESTLWKENCPDPGAAVCRGSRPFDCPSHQSVSNCFVFCVLIVMEVMVSWDRTDMWNTSSSAWNDSANGPVRVVGDVLPYDNPILALVLFSFCLATVFGNALVIAAVARERYLHTVTNYFITSLAVADCLVGSIVMPFSVAVEMQSDRRWLFGRDLWYIVLINKFLT